MHQQGMNESRVPTRDGLLRCRSSYLHLKVIPKSFEELPSEHGRGTIHFWKSDTKEKKREKVPKFLISCSPLPSYTRIVGVFLPGVIMKGFLKE